MCPCKQTKDSRSHDHRRAGAVLIGMLVDTPSFYSNNGELTSDVNALLVRVTSTSVFMIPTRRGNSNGRQVRGTE